MRYTSIETDYQPPVISTIVEDCINESNPYLFVLESGTYIKNCIFCVTEDMVEECFHDVNLVSVKCLAEGAKIDWIMKTFLRSPGNYKGLKEDLNQIIAANNLDDSQLKTNKKGILQACKRIFLILNDLMVPGGAAATALGLQKILPGLGKVAGTVAGSAGTASKVGLISKGTAATVSNIASAVTPTVIIGAIVAFIVGFIVNRIIRLLIDKSDFDSLRNDCYAIIDQLESNAAKATDPKLKQKYLDAAAQVKNSIKKYDQTNKPVQKKKKNALVPNPQQPNETVVQQQQKPTAVQK